MDMERRVGDGDVETLLFCKGKLELRYGENKFCCEEWVGGWVGVLEAAMRSFFFLFSLFFFFFFVEK